MCRQTQPGTTKHRQGHRQGQADRLFQFRSPQPCANLLLGPADAECAKQGPIPPTPAMDNKRDGRAVRPGRITSATAGHGGGCFGLATQPRTAGAAGAARGKACACQGSCHPGTTTLRASRIMGSSLDMLSGAIADGTLVAQLRETGAQARPQRPQRPRRVGRSEGRVLFSERRAQVTWHRRRRRRRLHDKKTHRAEQHPCGCASSEKLRQATENDLQVVVRECYAGPLSL